MSQLGTQGWKSLYLTALPEVWESELTEQLSSFLLYLTIVKCYCTSVLLPTFLDYCVNMLIYLLQHIYMLYIYAYIYATADLFTLCHSLTLATKHGMIVFISGKDSSFIERYGNQFGTVYSNTIQKCRTRGFPCFLVVTCRNVPLQLFDRLKLQDASVKKGADSKTVSGELALTNDSQTSGWKVGSGRGREEDEREKQKRLGRGGEKKVPGDGLHLAVRGEADVGSGAAHTGGATAGGTRTRSQARRKRRPKVDYQQVFTRHINQIFIRGENVLLVHLAH